MRLLCSVGTLGLDLCYLLSHVALAHSPDSGFGGGAVRIVLSVDLLVNHLALHENKK